MQIVSRQLQVCSRTGSEMLSSAKLLSKLHQHAARRGPGPVRVFRKYGFQPDKTTTLGTDLTFSDHAAIFEGRSTSDLLRALLVLRLCATPPFVTHSEALLDRARSLLGEDNAMGLVQESFYKHFCVGKEAADVWARMNALRAHGIGAILDYAEEEDLLRHCKPSGAAARAREDQGKAAGGGGVAVTSQEPLGGESIIESRVAARTYDYQDEDLCERHTSAFLAAIDTAATLPGQGFAAIKLTALGDPRLLEHVSACLHSVHDLFQRYDLDGDGFVTQAEFDQCYERLSRGQGGSSSADERAKLWRWLDADQAGRVDYISWAQKLDLRHMPAMAAGLESQMAVEKGAGPSRFWELSDQEQRELDGLFERLERLVQRAVSKGVKLMIDAEQSWLRPAIDHLAHDLMRKYNRSPADGAHSDAEAVILVTYQTYLRGARERLADDLARAEREGYKLGAKLVRGAYLHLERRRAAEAGLPSPVWDKIEQTHACFNDCLELLLQAVRDGRAELMVGSHNQPSVEAAVSQMARLGLDPAEAPVYFGQLMGMADNLSFTLGHHGYRIFKYCPYGSVEKVIPYLLRRVNENQYILKGGKRDVALLWAELWRRTLHDPAHSPLARILEAAQRAGGAAPPSSA